MAEEGEDILTKAILWLQKQQERLRKGFTIEFKGEEYTIVPDYIDRQVLRKWDQIIQLIQFMNDSRSP